MKNMETEEIGRRSKSTVGYSEAENKESFLTGVNVGATLSKKFYEAHVKELNRLLEANKKNYENAINDLHTICRIISKHS